MTSALTVGVDVGGTKIHAGLVAENGRILKRIKVPTQAKNGKKTILANIERCVSAVWDKKVRGIGMGIAGIVDAEKGIYLQGPNFPISFRRIPLSAWLKKRFRVPTAIDNDVHCFTLAEAVFGSAKKFSSVVGVTLGTGIGGGIVLDKKLYRGRNNAAGELGHMTISSSDAVCGCGMIGHFEALASGSAMTRLYEKATGKRLTATEIEDAAKSGDSAAITVFSEASAAIGVGMANIIQTLNPDVIVVGGGLSRAKALWRPMLAEAKRRVIYSSLRTTPILKTSLGDDANILGAALLSSKKHL